MRNISRLFVTIKENNSDLIRDGKEIDADTYEYDNSLHVRMRYMTTNQLPNLSRFKHLTKFRLCGDRTTDRRIKTKFRLSSLSCTSIRNISLFTVHITDDVLTLPAELRVLDLLNIFSDYSTISDITTALPNSIKKIQIQKFCTHGVQLHDLSSDIDRLTNIEIIRMMHVPIVGISDELCNISTLVDLELSNCSITEINPNVSRLTALTRLELNSNGISKIPDSLYSMTVLANLDLQDNRLVGSISPEIGRMIGLRTLVLENNDLSGEIPCTIVQLTNLQHLNLSDNNLSGSIPDLPDSLGYISLSNNTELCGTLTAKSSLRTDLKNTHILHDTVQDPNYQYIPSYIDEWGIILSVGRL